jgi:hypothetical protein
MYRSLMLRRTAHLSFERYTLNILLPTRSPQSTSFTVKKIACARNGGCQPSKWGNRVDSDVQPGSFLRSMGRRICKCLRANPGVGKKTLALLRGGDSRHVDARSQNIAVDESRAENGGLSVCYADRAVRECDAPQM